MKQIIFILLYISLFFGCVTIPKNNTKQKTEDNIIWRSDNLPLSNPRPEWCTKELEEKDDKKIFMGLSYNYSAEKDARDDAQNNAINKVTKYIGSDVKIKIDNLMTSYGLSSEIRNPTVVVKQVEEQLSKAFISKIKPKEWYIEKYEVKYADTSTKNYYIAFCLVTVPKDEIDRAIGEQLEEQRRISESASKTQQSVLQALEIFGKTKQNNDFKLSINTDRGPGAGFKDGEMIKYKVKSNKDCYLYIFHVNSSGEMSMLLPNPWSKNENIKSDIEYVLPDENMNFDFVVTAPYGSEAVVAIATLEEINALKPDYNKKEFKSIGSVNSTEVKRISEIIKNIPDTKKAISTYVLTTYGE